MLRPLAFQADPEWVHDLAHRLGERFEQCPGGLSMLSNLYAPPPAPELRQEIWGVTFENPFGLAAGFDKNSRLTRVIRALGFGFEEVGSITAQAAPGNPKPRLFRLPKDKAIINRMGLNNLGAEALQPVLQSLPTDWPIGISLAKTHSPGILGEAALEDFAASFRTIYGLGAYLSMNISCPNTKEGKTFEDPVALEALLSRLQQEEATCQETSPLTPRPWCLKVSPNLSLSQIQELFDVACRYNVAGWIACNTSAQRDGLTTPKATLSTIGHGGLSGAPLRHPSTRVLSELYRLCQRHRPQMILMGVGGIMDIDSAWEKITHGASLLQLYTGLIYEGPGLLRTLHQGLRQKLHDHHLPNLQSAIGSAIHHPNSLY